jgi:hypothetical protein
MSGHQTNHIDVFASAFAATSQAFIQAFLSQLAGAVGDNAKLEDRWRAEGCAAMWAAIQSAFLISTLRANERAVTLSLIMKYMAPFWLKHCPQSGNVELRLTTRASEYLRLSRSGNIVGSANSIVSALLRSEGCSELARPLTERMLASVLAHRMLTDVRRIDLYAARHSTSQSMK